MRRDLGVAAMVGGTFTAGYAHAQQISLHLAHVPWLGVGFCAAAMAAAGWLLAFAMVGPRPWLLLAGAAGHTVMLAVGGWSRTIGLPGEGVEDPTAAWVVAMCAEALVVAGCALTVRGGEHARQQALEAAGDHRAGGRVGLAGHGHGGSR